MQTIAALGSITKVLFAWLLMLEATGWCGKDTCLNGYAWASMIAVRFFPSKKTARQAEELATQGREGSPRTGRAGKRGPRTGQRGDKDNRE